MSTTPTTEQRCGECDAQRVMGPAIMRAGMVFSLPRPFRHNDVIARMAELGIKTPIGHGLDMQGFMTCVGFRDRRMTAVLIGSEKGAGLTSEDLW